MRQNLTKPLLIVVAAALTDAAGRILLQKRRTDAEHGGLWEFPGGKMESGEHPKSAIVRELFEEIGIMADESDLLPLGFASSDRPAARPILLLLYRCSRWSGEPVCLDAESIAWFGLEAIAGLDMPPLDIDLVRDALRLTN